MKNKHTVATIIAKTPTAIHKSLKQTIPHHKTHYVKYLIWFYLLGEWRQFTRFDEKSSFEGSYSSKTPARTTHTLI